MKAVILVPYRSDGAERERNWKIAKDRWKELLPIPTFYGNSETEEFERAHARNQAARLAGDWDVALFADADIILRSIQQAEAAIMRCYRTGAYTVAYSTLHYLTEDGTKYVSIEGSLSRADYDETVMHTWECCFAVRRDVWDEVGGFDERFSGYGGQGLSFYYAASTLAGRERIAGTAYHLAHKLVDRTQEPHFLENMELCARYQAAVDNQHAMRLILGER